MARSKPPIEKARRKAVEAAKVAAKGIKEVAKEEAKEEGKAEAKAAMTRADPRAVKHPLSLLISLAATCGTMVHVSMVPNARFSIDGVGVSRADGGSLRLRALWLSPLLWLSNQNRGNC